MPAFVALTVITANLTARLRRDLEAIVGARRVSIDPVDRDVYARDMWPRLLLARRAGEAPQRLPDVIVWPETAREVAAIVKVARAARVPIVPYGGGSGVCGGAVPVLGCILYELVAARPPFVAEGAGELIGAHLYVMPDPPSVHGAEISPEFEALIMRLLAKRPEDRVASATDLAQLLTEIAGRAARHEPMLLSPVSGALSAMTPSSPSYQGVRSPAPDGGAHQPKPTTLGGVASESVARIAPAGGNTWWRPALIGGAVASAALAGYLVMTRGGAAAAGPPAAPRYRAGSAAP